MYDPRVGRFIEPDWLGLDADVNTYRYVGNSPTKYIDPSGKDRIEADPTPDGLAHLYYVDEGGWDDPPVFIGTLDPGTKLVYRNGHAVPLPQVVDEVDGALTTGDWNAWFKEQAIKCLETPDSEYIELRSKELHPTFFADAYDFKKRAKQLAEIAVEFEATIVFLAQPTTVARIGKLAPSGPAAEVANQGIWDLGPGIRGGVIERRLGQNLPRSFPVIDKFRDGIATSIKSMDLRSTTYQNVSRITQKGREYIDKVACFQGDRLGKTTIAADQIKGRALEIAVPYNASAKQRIALNGLVKYGRAKGVDVKIIELK